MAQLKSGTTIDGDLLVADTSGSVYNDASGGGINLKSDGAIHAAKESSTSTDPVALFNNTGVNGDIAQFRKDGTTVGSIGTISSYLTIGSGVTGLLFDDITAKSIRPWDLDSNTPSEDIDLGISSQRFKDLYLSGKVNATTLELTGSGAGDDFIVATDKLVVEGDTGNVGIGTGSPATYGGKVNICDGTVGGETNLVVANNNANQFIRMGIKDSVAQITWDNGDSIAFGENTDSTSSGITTEHMRIDSSGNVGIGTGSPVAKLHLKNTTANDGPMIRLHGSGQNASNNLIGGIEVYNSDTSGDGPTNVCNIKAYSASSYGSGGYLTFGTHDGTEGGEGSEPREVLRIDSSGYVGIGITSPSHRLHINGVGRSTQSTWATSSDERVKENIVAHPEALPIVNQLQPRQFNFKSDYRADNPTETGFIAQEFEAVIPSAVTTLEREEWEIEAATTDEEGNELTPAVMDGLDEFKVLNTSCLLPLLVKAVQEQSAIIDELKQQVNSLGQA